MVLVNLLFDEKMIADSMDNMEKSIFEKYEVFVKNMQWLMMML